MSDVYDEEWRQKISDGMHHSQATADEIRDIYNNPELDVTQQELADEFGMSQSAVSQIVNGKYWIPDNE